MTPARAAVKETNRSPIPRLTNLLPKTQSGVKRKPSDFLHLFFIRSSFQQVIVSKRRAIFLFTIKIVETLNSGPVYTSMRSAEYSMKVQLNYARFSDNDVSLDSISGSLIQTFSSGVFDLSRWLKFRLPGHRLLVLPPTTFKPDTERLFILPSTSSIIAGLRR